MVVEGDVWLAPHSMLLCVGVHVERGGGAPWEGRGVAEGRPELSQTGGPLHPQGPGGNGGSLWEDEERPETTAAHQLLVRLLVSLHPVTSVNICTGTQCQGNTVIHTRH